MTNLLTEQQHHAIALRCNWYTTREVADAMCVEPSTVKRWLADAYMRLGIDGRNHKLAQACRMLRGLE